ncbi:hypothetical protein BBO99_00001619 [Phytophthora kernoviae]|uniref:Uncharacterized protein n=2 Tax=Phytophthora kernoviae TaxID=325452 RepID=A0A3R7H1K3_9STRA|nr:hypothetical protein G195_002236 [Phytophthora kernoviae 00238/432]KAG2531224.1 hypothetical protein JM16_001199 [Phytophthora kernoviae]KAG2531899.1 hypothetical protein JM18_001536 [Phytophthora kernoviae]RLN45658.1 hypothetical protein BBI17_001389 [Phytophthora kernoviae]RLN84029.1 hypothetical protein BBO99_00001619 [Phytophthora kernoviae]
MKSQDVVIPSPPESANPASLSDPSSTLMVLDSNAALGNSTSNPSAPTYPVNDIGRSPPRPGLPHTASESTLTKETLLNILEMRARGMSTGSLTDPAFVQQLHNLEDSFPRNDFDDRESSLEAAIRSEEEKHQREIERFRKKMEEFDRQRAAIARQQNGGDGAMHADANATPVETDNDVGLPMDGSDEEPLGQANLWNLRCHSVAGYSYDGASAFAAMLRGIRAE